MSREDLIAEAPFDYQLTKGGLTQIFYRGRLVKTLSGRESNRFSNKLASLGPAEAQLAMARITGHFKHGTERVSKSMHE